MTIISSDIESVELKTSNNYQDYFFVNCDVEIEVSIAGDTHQAVLQTGHSYYLGDYSLPSNCLDVYDDSINDVLVELDNYSETELDDSSNIEQINDVCDTEYTMKELQDAHAELREVMQEAQALVSEAEQEAEEKLEADETVYVLESFYEECGHGRRECGEPSLVKFATQDEASEYIENNDDCEIISRARAYRSFAHQM